jgi:ribosomal protein S18 acetylase RimI-like enzyme
MLDYTLVSTRATYRMPTPRDLPALVGLVQALYREDQPGAEITIEKVLTTVRELDRDHTKGSMFVFEREGLLAGYAILVPYWSNELGGTILIIDELYVEPAQRRKGIASEFLTLVRKVAPSTVRALQLEVNRGNRAALAFYRKLGFRDQGRRVLSMPAADPGGAPGPTSLRP